MGITECALHTVPLHRSSVLGRDNMSFSLGGHGLHLIQPADLRFSPRASIKPDICIQLSGFLEGGPAPVLAALTAVGP